MRKNFRQREQLDGRVSVCGGGKRRGTRGTREREGGELQMSLELGLAAMRVGWRNLTGLTGGNLMNIVALRMRYWLYCLFVNKDILQHINGTEFTSRV